MRRLYILIFGLLLLPPWLTATAQQPEEPDSAAPVSEEATSGDDGASEDADEDDDLDDSDLDLQTYEEDEDDFVPTEEIPADEAIPFPSDI